MLIFWIIFGIISLCIQLYMLKHTWIQVGYGEFEFDFNKAKKLEVPIWAILVIFITSITPIANCIELLFFCVVYANYHPLFNYFGSWEKHIYWKFNDRFLSRKI